MLNNNRVNTVVKELIKKEKINEIVYNDGFGYNHHYKPIKKTKCIYMMVIVITIFKNNDNHF